MYRGKPLPSFLTLPSQALHFGVLAVLTHATRRSSVPSFCLLCPSVLGKLLFITPQHHLNAGESLFVAERKLEEGRRAQGRSEADHLLKVGRLNAIVVSRAPRVAKVVVRMLVQPLLARGRRESRSSAEKLQLSFACRLTLSIC